MDGEVGEKELPPSDRKLRRLREEGQVAQSRDLTSAASWIGAAFVLSYLGHEFVHELLTKTRSLWRDAVRGSLTLEGATTALHDGLLCAIEAIVPIIVGAAALGLLAQCAQIGILFAPSQLAPKLERLDPIRGLKEKLFSSTAWADLAKSILKLAIVAFTCWIVIRNVAPKIFAARSGGLDAIVDETGSAAFRIGAWCGGCILVLAVADFALQRYRFRKVNGMSRSELKREIKDEMGDPIVRQRRDRARAEMQAELAAAMMKRERPDVVVVNPTHVAVALRIDAAIGGHPRVIARGEGVVAARIREIAIEKRIPIKRAVKLARALVELEIGAGIPKTLVDAVVAVYRWLEKRERMRGREAAFLAQLEALMRNGDRIARNGDVRDQTTNRTKPDS